MGMLVAVTLALGLSWSVPASGHDHEAPPGTLMAARGGKKPAKKPAPAPPSPAPAEPVAAPAPAAGPALPDPPPLPQKFRAVALMPVVGLSVEAELVHSVEVALLREIDEVPGLRAVTPADVANDLRAVGLSTECGSSLPCLAQAGRYARAHLTLEARVASLGGALSVSLRLVDTQKGSEFARVAEPVSDKPNERASELHRMAVQLLTPDTYVGTLHLKSAQAGAEIYLDDQLVGTTPLKPLAGLRAGPHVMRVTMAGYADLHRFVDVAYKRSTTINIDLTNTTVSGVIVEDVSASGFGALFVLAAEPGIEVRIDGEPRGVTPLSGAILKVAAGKRRVSFRREGMAPVNLEVTITAERRTDLALRPADGDKVAPDVLGTVAVDAPLPAAAEVLAANEPTVVATTVPPDAGRAWQGPTLRTPIGLAVGGLGVVALGVAGYFGNKVKTYSERAEDLLHEGNQLPAGDDRRDEIAGKLDRINDKGPAAEAAQWISLGTGIGLVAIGGGLVLWDFHQVLFGEAVPEPAAGSARVSAFVIPLPGGSVVGAAWPF